MNPRAYLVLRLLGTITFAGLAWMTLCRGLVSAEENEVPRTSQLPFPHRVAVPEFPADMAWLNTRGPLKLKDLRGKFVLLDFWTYCCINCIHILPELKKLEQAYPDQLVVIGVHSAKFDTEQNSRNISEAILRYEIEHPVVNDHQHRIWNMFGVRSWPTMILIDPDGKAVYARSGEFKFELVDSLLKQTLPIYRAQNLLDETPIRFDLLAHDATETPLRFPGKILADEASSRLFIADSNHNRIVIADLQGQLKDVVGSGKIGQHDGPYSAATFSHPQGMALDGDILYVADTENHLIRKVDLLNRTVSTIAGTGVQGRSAWPGFEQGFKPPVKFVGRPLKTRISSPWALWARDGQLYIAMAGPHQIWKMALDGSEIGPYAGNGREDIVDGPLLPREPYGQGYSSFAQPSGLVADDTWLYVADSEGSSIRAVPFDPELQVKTIVGSAQLPQGRLFAFGDLDGTAATARLQHALGVTLVDDHLYVADTYNHKIKEIDLQSSAVVTIAGAADGTADEQDNAFNEPAGISYADQKLYVADTNNHRIRTVDLDEGHRVDTLIIRGLAPPEYRGDEDQESEPELPGAIVELVDPVQVRPEQGHVTIRAVVNLPEGWKMNPLAPMGYVVRLEQDSGPVGREGNGKFTRVENPVSEIDMRLPVMGTGQESVQIFLKYYYCGQDGGGLCKVGSVIWTVPLQIAADAPTSVVTVSHTVPR